MDTSYYTTTHTGRTDEVAVAAEGERWVVDLEWREAPYHPGSVGVRGVKAYYPDADSAKAAGKALADRLKSAPKSTHSLHLLPRLWDDGDKAKSEWLIREIRHWAEELAESGVAVEIR